MSQSASGATSSWQNPKFGSGRLDAHTGETDTFVSMNDTGVPKAETDNDENRKNPTLCNLLWTIPTKTNLLE